MTSRLPRVLWDCPDPETGQVAHTIPAVVVTQGTKQVHIRATLPDGRVIYRWVHPRHLREAESDEPADRGTAVSFDRADRG